MLIIVMFIILFVFFFKQKTAYEMRISDWSSDVCSSDLLTYIDNVGTTINELGGLSGDDHPVADIRNGQAFLNEVSDILRRGQHWEKTLLVINYDEWGGFSAHVPPPFAPVTDANAALGHAGRLATQCPRVLIDPPAIPGRLAHPT